MALVAALRAYRSAGSTLASQSLTPTRKLATITVSATDSARLATTPATAAVAVRRWKRARCTASSGSAPRAGGTAASRACTTAGTSATPPNSNAATAT